MAKSDHWKQIERDIAAILAGERNPVSGRSRGDMSDVDTPDFSIECKHGKNLPAFVRNAFAQADAAVAPHQLPVVAMHVHGSPVKNTLILMRLEDFVHVADAYSSARRFDRPPRFVHRDDGAQHGTDAGPPYGPEEGVAEDRG